MAGHSAAFEVVMAQRAQMNYESILAFIATLSAVAIIFSLSRAIRHWSWSASPSENSTRKPSYTKAIFRQLRSMLLCRAPGLPSVGHAIIIGIYAGVNFIITFTNMDHDRMDATTNIASRTGWMAVANMVLVVLLAAKNTPLAFITRFSYERLNILHQVAGYTTLALVIIHASCYSSHFVEDGNPERLTTLEETFGMVAGLSFLFLGISGGIIKRWWYELFYYTHICFWIVAIVSLGLHQPEMSKKVLIGTSIGGGIWVIDRLIRLARLLIYTTNNRVKVTPLPNGGTRLSLAKAPLGAVSGQHCFLWIPGIRFFETHPFTIASMDSPEFVIASYDGFTQDLHNFAVEHPGTALKASAEGAYGVFPDPKGYHTSIFVAGGSGASFTFGMALNMLRKTNRRTRRVVFVWVVRNEGYLEWFSTHLDFLKNEEIVELKIHITRPSALDTTDIRTRTQGSHSPTTSSEKVAAEELEERMVPTDSDRGLDHEESPKSGFGAGIDQSLVKHGKPCIPSLISAVISETSADHRVLVMGCGPITLMDEVRRTTAANIRAEGPVVELHCEQFGW